MEKIVALEQIDAFSKKYPGVFKMFDKLFSYQGTSWHKEYCYCPVGLALAYVQECMDPREREIDPLFPAKDAGKLAVLASWRQGKSVYRIDEGLTHEFLKSVDDDIKVTSDLLTIPQYCIYIDTQRGIKDIDGLFVMFDDDKARGRKELYIMTVQDGEMGTQVYLTIPYEPELLSMILGKSWIEAHESIKGQGISAENEENYFKVSRKIIRYVINVLMYLSAINAEIRFTNRQSVRTHGKAKDTAKGVKKFMVGEHIGVRLKKFQKYTTRYEHENNNDKKSGGTHKSPIMHIRRAHYHTFLVGAGRKEKRIKWLPPIVVNAAGEEIDYVSVTSVDDK